MVPDVLIGDSCMVVGDEQIMHGLDEKGTCNRLVG